MSSNNSGGNNRSRGNTRVASARGGSGRAPSTHNSNNTSRNSNNTPRNGNNTPRNSNNTPRNGNNTPRNGDGRGGNSNGGRAPRTAGRSGAGSGGGRSSRVKYYGGTGSGGTSRRDGAQRRANDSSRSDGRRPTGNGTGSRAPKRTEERRQRRAEMSQDRRTSQRRTNDDGGRFRFGRNGNNNDSNNRGGRAPAGGQRRGGNNTAADSQTARLVQELRNRIRKLEQSTKQNLGDVSGQSTRRFGLRNNNTSRNSTRDSRDYNGSRRGENNRNDNARRAPRDTNGRGLDRMTGRRDREAAFNHRDAPRQMDIIDRIEMARSRAAMDDGRGYRQRNEHGEAPRQRRRMETRTVTPSRNQGGYSGFQPLRVTVRD